MQRLALYILLVALTSAELYAAGPKLAFPGAVGFGATAAGGRGGDVYHVTTLADGGAGSLRDAVETANGPRTIVFEISGTIDLQSPLRIEADNLTIAGQTSPGGITLRGYPAEIFFSNDIVVRYLRFRPGDVNAASIPGKPGRGNNDLSGDAADSLTIIRCDNVIVDHVSASWSMDETLSVTKSTNVTIQHSIVSESLHDSFHPEGVHGRGSLVRGQGERGYTFYRNLWAHHNRRSPSLGGQQDPPPPGQPGLGLDVDLVGNVIYDWGLLPTHTVADPYQIRLNMIGNTYVSGPTVGCPCVFLQIEGTAEEVQVFQRGNRVDRNENGTLDTRAVQASDFVGAFTFVDRPFRFDRRRPRGHSARAAYRRVLRDAGASHARDAVDDRVVAQVEQQNGGLVNSQDDVGGWPAPPNTDAPPADLDRDGMADDWESSRGLNPSDASDRNGFDLRRAYTNLEVYLHSLTRRRRK